MGTTDRFLFPCNCAPPEGRCLAAAPRALARVGWWSWANIRGVSEQPVGDALAQGHKAGLAASVDHEQAISLAVDADRVDIKRMAGFQQGVLCLGLMGAGVVGDAPSHALALGRKIGRVLMAGGHLPVWGGVCHDWSFWRWV